MSEAGAEHLVCSAPAAFLDRPILRNLPRRVGQQRGVLIPDPTKLSF